MPSNITTPRLFIAATGQDDGKTTTCLGLFATIQKYFSNIGYIKPVGQRFVSIEGMKIDEDSVLMSDTYRIRSSLSSMSPIAVEPSLTRKYLSGENTIEFHARVIEAFDEAAWEKDFILIEGTGHAGVGSIFNLSNATVASLVGSKVIIVSKGGIGRPIDEIALNLPLFEKNGVEVIGVIVNKMHEEKRGLIKYIEEGLKQLGLPLLGVIPYHKKLHEPTLNQICKRVKGKFIVGEKFKCRHISEVFMGVMSADNVGEYCKKGSLLITSGDRDVLIVKALGTLKEGGKDNLSGIIFSDGRLPSDGMIDFIRHKNVPCICCENESFVLASKINNMTVKIEIGDNKKIGLIQELIEKNVDVKKIIEKL